VNVYRLERFHNSRALTNVLRGGFFLVKSHLAVADLRMTIVEPLYSIDLFIAPPTAEEEEDL
jgi:hypothetical protein